MWFIEEKNHHQTNGGADTKIGKYRIKTPGFIKQETSRHRRHKSTEVAAAATPAMASNAATGNAPAALSELSDPAALPLPYWAQVVTATEERLAEALAAIQPPALPPVTLPPPPAAAPRPEPVAARTMTVNPAPSPAWWMANYSALMHK